ncbi:hypothetical protein A3C57_00725 [Candidatus Nomurabacteria bacterium RIFCSPHIGHO2_02_FULL_33_12]|uniref:isoleucine--tRNA ligase n=1 Tax=Candidatus Nomurabacteria bacterium RIFCSPLOWO2_01_FULL_33_17 TaxID=1801764 RepID=A0A1F6WQV7_9BACT|nr:MAG: hypothetical protein A3C57_00725 [Candidatus Nomurabacteria bacterium RIFCSPHIGHO2_02_FULL_33_12]OGI84257.1 MAG: hypothetical protein A2903_00065 [Candidatus Nomurabacteria bacterium RIFCSPLOWO2_01_FULL_33_17]
MWTSFYLDNINYMKEEKISKSINEHELEIMSFWKDNKIFEKSLEKDSPNGEFVFYDGPPTANGRPGIHHLEARAFKDAIPRYKTMQGYHVGRKGGWDTHGLPVELQVEKELGFVNKKQIEEYGIGNFNNECKKSVWTYIDEWQKFTDRVGYWIDQDNPYITYESNYIESLWNIVAEVDKKNLLYKDYRIVPWCSRCGTALSSHELAQGYKDVKDLSITAKFKILGQENTYLLAWTTTPWTLPGNVALAVNVDLSYVKIKKDADFLILGKDRLSIVDGEYEIVEEYIGKDLIGLSYEPLYPFFVNQISHEQKDLPTGQTGNLDKAYKVYEAGFVNANDGTGIVHTAVMYGQDDFELGTKLGLPKYHLVGLDGTFNSEMNSDELELSNRFVKDEQVAIDIIKDLAHRGLLFKKEKYEHSYPYCWRCQTPLIYYTRDSWYIRMSELRDDLVMNNDFINWEPKHIQNGRFGEWLREVKDWAISRERYWGTPLPVWIGQNGEKHIFTNHKDLQAATKKSGNKYFVMRHGEAENNIKNVWDSKPNSIVKLTEKGKDQVQNSAQGLKDKNIDLIICSPLLRTKMTAEIVADVIGYDKNEIIFDERLCEMNPGEIYQGRDLGDFLGLFSNYKDRYIKENKDGENYQDVKNRVMNALYDFEEKYQNKNILIFSHGGPVLNMVIGSLGLSKNEIPNNIEDFHYSQNAEWKELDFVPLPHNENYELDLHRPYIDDYPVYDKNGNKLQRVPEVMDCWFDSGCMPFAQDGYPFKTDQVSIPADYICEGIDQTRGWFYTLHAVSALMGRGPAYKNVICLGLVMDKDGQKMSKSRGNTVDPWDLCNRFGADALRFWMYSINQPGDFKNFDEKTVDEVIKKVFNLLRNVYAFYDLYRDKTKENLFSIPNSNNVLDKWILIKLMNLIKNTTLSLDNYSLLPPTREIRNFIDELSTWYTRRSRLRIRGGDMDAHNTLYFVLKNLAKIMAPFTPFVAEELWQDLRLESDPISVHLVNWPDYFGIPESDFILETMEKVQDICTVGHSLRKKYGIPVRQILRTFFITDNLSMDYIVIVADELNVESVVIGDKVDFDTEINEELKSEGNFRELVRFVQDMRKARGLKAHDKITVQIKTNDKGKDFLNFWEQALLSEVSAKEMVLGEEINGSVFKIDNLIFDIDIN